MKYIIRTATAEDAAAVHDIYGAYIDEENITFAVVNPGIAEYREKIEKTLKKYPFYVAEAEDGKILGYVYASQMRPHEAYDWNVESTIALAPDAPRRQGIASALYAKLAETLTAQGYRYIYAVVLDNNIPSIKLHEAAGFKNIAHFETAGYKLGKWRGIYWMLKPLGEEGTEPSEITDFENLK